MLAADIQTEYQSLAPRKVAFVCTDAAQIMTTWPCWAARWVPTRAT